MKINYLLIISALVFFSCHKESTSDNDSGNKQVDVYVAGFVADASAPDRVHPVYWKNGNLMNLSDDIFIAAWATSIAISGNDVYVAGYRLNTSTTPTTTIGVLWKNGVLVNLGLGDHSRLTSLTTSNNNVYAAVTPGPWPTIYGPTARFMKNESLISLDLGFASGIAVSENNVYVSGNWGAFAKYWKNGNPVTLTDGSTFDFTTSIAVSETDVYVAGTHNYRTDFSGEPISGIACYWKNGNLQRLTDGNTLAGVTSLAVTGKDVYLTGYDIDLKTRQSFAFYWKNLSPVKLSDGSANAEATSIAVSGNDVYAAGIRNERSTIYGPVGIACYWKNGKLIDLTDGSMQAGANSIFLAKK